MKVAIVGASGATGRLLVEAALRRGHEVTGVVRRPERFQAPEGVRVVVADVADQDRVADAVRGQDAVVSALGAATPIRRDATLVRGVRHIVEAMTAAGVRRLVSLSFLGVPGGRRQLSLIPRVVARIPLRAVTADHAEKEAIIRASGLDWTLVRPWRLTGGPSTGRARHGEQIRARMLSSVSRADVAEFMIVALDDPSTIGTAPAIVS